MHSGPRNCGLCSLWLVTRRPRCGYLTREHGKTPGFPHFSVSYPHSCIRQNARPIKASGLPILPFFPIMEIRKNRRSKPCHRAKMPGMQLIFPSSKNNRIRLHPSAKMWRICRKPIRISR